MTTNKFTFSVNKIAMLGRNISSFCISEVSDHNKKFSRWVFCEQWKEHYTHQHEGKSIT